MVGKIAILLSTYDGEPFLEQLLDSILNQQVDEGMFALFIRDDGSKDRTADILWKYSYTEDRIVWMKDELGNLGAKESFFHMLRWISSHHDFEYYMFCDQDDIWLPYKIRKTLEQAESSNRPVLVHTNLIVVDENRNVISPSFWRFQKLDPKHVGLNRLLVQNVITGCTVLIHKDLVPYVTMLRSSDNVIMHDWWVALVASIFGEIVYSSESTVLYRQHNNNSVGAQRYSLFKLYKRFWKKKYGLELIKQAQKLLDVYEPQLNQDQIETLYAFLQCRKNRLTKLYMSLKYGFWKHGILRNTGWIFKKIS